MKHLCNKIIKSGLLSMFIIAILMSAIDMTVSAAGGMGYYSDMMLQPSNPTNLPTPTTYQGIVPPISANTILVGSSAIAVGGSGISAGTIATALTANGLIVSANTVLSAPGGMTVTIPMGTTISAVIGSGITTGTVLQVAQQGNTLLVGRTDASYIFNKPIQISVPTVKSSVSVLAKHIGYADRNTIGLTLNPNDTCYSDGSTDMGTPGEFIVPTNNGMTTFYTCRASEFYVDVLPWTGYSIDPTVQTGFNGWYQDIPHYITSTSNVILSWTQPLNFPTNGTLRVGIWGEGIAGYSIVGNPLITASPFVVPLINRWGSYVIGLEPMSGSTQTHQEGVFGLWWGDSVSRLVYSPINYYQIVGTNKVFEPYPGGEKRMLSDRFLDSAPTRVSDLTGLSLAIEANQVVQYVLTGLSLQTGSSGMLSIGLNTIPLDIKPSMEGTSGANTFIVSLMLSGGSNSGWEHMNIYYNKNTPTINMMQSAYHTGLNMMAYRLNLDYMTGKNWSGDKVDNSFYLSIGGSCSIGSTMWQDSDSLLTGSYRSIHDSSMLRGQMRRYWTSNNNADLGLLLAPGTYSDCTVTVVSEYGVTGNTIAIPSFSINAATPILMAGTSTVYNNGSIVYSFSGNMVPGSGWVGNSDAIQLSGSCLLIDQANDRNVSRYYNNLVGSTHNIIASVSGVGSGDYTCGVRYRTLQGDWSNRAWLIANTASMRSNRAISNNYFGFSSLVLGSGVVNIPVWRSNYPQTNATINISTGNTMIATMGFAYPSISSTMVTSLGLTVPRQGNGYYDVRFDGAVDRYNPSGMLTSYQVSRTYTNGVTYVVSSSTPVNAPLINGGFPLSGLVRPLSTNMVVTNAPTVFSIGGVIMTIPAATQISTVVGTNIATGSVLTASVVGTTVSFGLPSSSIRFSNPVRIALPLPSNYNTSQSIGISVRHRPDTFFSNVGLTNNSNATCDTIGNPSIGNTSTATIEGNHAVIYTCRASEFQFIVPLLTNTPTAGGGGGGSRLTMDYCPGGDFSSSYYDSSCTSDNRPNTTSWNNNNQTISYNIMTMPLGQMSNDQMRMRVDMVFARMKSLYEGKRLTLWISMLKRLSRAATVSINRSELLKKRSASVSDLMDKSIYIIKYFKAVIDKEIKNPTLSSVSSGSGSLQTSISTQMSSVRIESTKDTWKINETIPVTMRVLDRNGRIATRNTSTVYFELVRLQSSSLSVSDTDRDKPTAFGVYDMILADKGSKSFSNFRIKKAGVYDLVIKDLFEDTIVGTKRFIITN